MIWGKIFFSVNDAGTTGYPQVKEREREFRAPPHIIHKNSFRIDPRLKWKS